MEGEGKEGGGIGGARWRKTGRRGRGTDEETDLESLQTKVLPFVFIFSCEVINCCLGGKSDPSDYQLQFC